MPVNVVKHFLEDVRRHGRYTGVRGLGVRLQGLESAPLRRHFGLPEEGSSGMRVMEVAPLAPAAALLRQDDVILRVDGVEVS